FFSSRRRHTRFSRDWSSDVCSSDLGHGLHGRSDDQSSFLMTPPGERYDLAHFEFVMRGIARARQRFPELADAISLSLHCETAEIMAASTSRVQQAGQHRGPAAYPPSLPLPP